MYRLMMLQRPNQIMPMKLPWVMTQRAQTQRILRQLRRCYRNFMVSTRAQSTPRIPKPTPSTLPPQQNDDLDFHLFGGQLHLVVRGKEWGGFVMLSGDLQGG